MKKLQSGRSMVEMLGVLAIIGVLSIGGIAGYTLSMRRYRANNILDAAAKYATIAYSNCQQELLNGSFDEINQCKTSNVTTFTNAGIGDLPAGVTEISFSSFVEYASTNDGASRITIIFNGSPESEKLCQSALSITGTKKTTIRHDGMKLNNNICDNNHAMKILDVYIRQN